MNILKNIAIIGVVLAAAMTAPAATVTGEDVIKMKRAGVSDEVIIQTIESSNSNFYLSAQDVEALKREGVTERVIGVMQQKRDVPAKPKAEGATTYEKAATTPAPPKQETVVRAEQVVRAYPVYPQPAPAYYYPPPPPTYYYRPAYYYDPWYPPVSFSFGYYGGHHHHYRSHCW
ncbi:MAG: hypothetical protein HZA91_07955 [Verrucomicrobia bacterium]|nr:hypothetical protein [Verrucomicrobiota bacterium]